jgi:TfoX/Sxy family transcriptional regulator of competence genes
MSFIKTVTPRLREDYSEEVARRIRRSLAHLPNVEEKKMFSGISFLVDEKMCISVGKTGIMFRIDPAIHEEALQKNGCATVTMQGREYKGWIRITEDGMKSRQDFEHWVHLALEFNGKARKSKKHG